MNSTIGKKITNEEAQALDTSTTIVIFTLLVTSLAVPALILYLNVKVLLAPF